MLLHTKFQLNQSILKKKRLQTQFFLAFLAISEHSKTLNFFKFFNIFWPPPPPDVFMI